MHKAEKLQTVEPEASSQEGRIFYRYYLLHPTGSNFLNHLKHLEYVKQPRESKEEDLIQTQISDKDNESKVSSINSTPATGLSVNREIRNSH